MASNEQKTTGILKDVFEISTTKQVVVIVTNIDGEMPSKAVIRAGDLVSEVTGVDYPRTVIDLPDGSRDLDFSVLGMALKSGSKADWLRYRGQSVKIVAENL